MKNPSFLKSGRCALLFAAAGLAPLVVGQVNAAPAGSAKNTEDARVASASGAVEDGTIPAARPGLPQIPRGAQGPIRSDTRSSDPSIRDSNPLTLNGLWETLPGNRVSRPGQQ